MKKITFDNLTVAISDDTLKQDVFDIDFNSEMMVRFERIKGELIPTNAMNGYGNNCFQEIADKRPKVE